MKNRKIVGVMFDERESSNNSIYYYYTDIDFALQDLAIVCVHNRGTGWAFPSYPHFKIVRVVETSGFTAIDIAKAKKWIVQKIDIKAYEERLEQEKLVQDIKAELAARKAEFEERRIYEYLAKEDPKINAMLDKLSTLTGEQRLIPQTEEPANAK